MRPFFMAAASLVSFSLFMGCATGLRAEADAPPLVLSASLETIRVRILKADRPLKLASSGPFQFQSKKGGTIYDGKSAIAVRALHGRLVFDHKSFKGDVAVVPVNSTDTLKLNGRRYRGTFVFHPLGGGRYDVVEFVALQDYLYGVLPREVGSTWPLEALKAQAVVSRTYVLANRATDPEQRFDVFNDVTHQVYGGLEDEAAATNLAVDKTQGEILVDNQGKPIQAFFHSSCGGQTETPDNVWLKQDNPDVYSSVSDDYCKEDPYNHWKVDLKTSFIRAHLRKAGYRMGDIKKIVIGKKSSSGRAVTFWVYTSGGKTEIQGNRFRIAMGPEILRSTLITDISYPKKSIHFEGRGWGHGVGLCQWGARGRAAAGQTYSTILTAYYPKAALKCVIVQPK
jgi:stage II sporulation protein D